MGVLDSILGSLFSDVKKIGSVVSTVLVTEQATVVIPAFNEAKTIRKVASIAVKTPFVNEVIVIDDGSSDNTAEEARKVNGVRVVVHPKNMGKGRAIRTGMAEATNDTVVFVDADVQTLTPEKIKRLILPVLLNQADLVKASFFRARGRLTALAAQPMMKLLFPQVSLDQPLSGQFAGRKSFLQSVTIEEKWGIDIAILLDALNQGKRVLEVDIGELVHKERSLEDLARTSEQVLETMIKKAGLVADKYPFVLFSEYALFDGKNVRKHATEVLLQLRRRKFKTVLLGQSPRSDLEQKANQLLLDDYIAAGAQLSAMELLSFCKKAIRKRGSRLSDVAFVGVKPSEAILVKSVGLGIALGSNPTIRKAATHHIDSLAELLLVLE